MVAASIGSYGAYLAHGAYLALFCHSSNSTLEKWLAHGYPFLEAEVVYCARNECCESAIDFIARRSRLAFLDTDAVGRA
ncbi:hypothetical protein R6Q59_025062 [Mikania micrantha]